MPREFNGRGHLIGCSEWARLWERFWGRANLDAATIKNLEAMAIRGRGMCCRPAEAEKRQKEGT
jgi:hypothetical protein